MPDFFLANPGAAVAGVVAFACLTIWPLFRSRRGILVMQLGASIAFASHYALLGFMAPAAVNVLGSGQTIAAMFAPNSPALNRVGYTLVGLMIAAGVYFWTGPVSALCVAAMALIAIGRMQASNIALRVLILGGGVCWTVHDYLVGSHIALGADLTSLTTGLATLVPLLWRDRVSAAGARLKGDVAAVRAVLVDALDFATAALRLDPIASQRRALVPVAPRREPTHRP